MVIVLFAIFSLAYSAVPKRMTDEEKLQWAKEGVNEYCVGVKAEYMPKYGGIGLIATQDLAFKKEYCNIPWKYTLNSYDDYEWTDEFKDTSRRVRLVARLIYFKFISTDQDDFFWKYVNSNPEEFHGSMTWTTTEMENLRKWAGNPTLLRQNIEQYWNDWAVYEAKMKKLAPECTDCATLDSYTWGYMMTLSRSFVYGAHTQKYLTFETDKAQDHRNNDTGYAMYPIIDLVNHTNFFEWKDYDRPIGTLFYRAPYSRFTILTQAYTKADEEVFFDYGGKKNDELINAHGFVIVKNQYEKFKMHAINPGEKCPSDSAPDKAGCWFTLFPGQFNTSLFNYLSKAKITGNTFKERHLKGLLWYRTLVYDTIDHHSSIPMREAKRRKIVENNNHHLVALDYVVALRLAIHHHRALIEKAMMGANLRHLELY